eukprot:CAMPEP_0171491502 /NCGR_PEP_ID=MMETSP0958-20121227/3894_1 /TAXON_ID=87120 /ORGANISM="Aurantiochytrium limacinum, Strain ATCCMYA-1381" /LENGTH=465 /DNA_ID=CAMNT_0012024925 /DNA_START=210 /DNA_END=1604 /DNA_ORIENTATION=+
MMGDRSSWIGREAKVNGLFAANVMPKRRQKNKVMPSSHVPDAADTAASVRAAHLQGELDALRNVVSEESRMKDKLLDTMSERCSKAEARIEELLHEKARVERELAAIQYNLQEQTNSEHQIKELKSALEQAHAEVKLAKNSSGDTERSAAQLSRQLQNMQQMRAQELQAYNEKAMSLQNQVYHLEEEVDNLRKVAASQQQAALQNEEFARTSKSAQSQLAGTVEEMREEREEMQKALRKLMAENEQLRESNRTLLNRSEEGEAALESTKKRIHVHSDKLREQEKLLKDSQEAVSAAEAKATRLADQLKASNKKAGFLVKKAEVAQEKLVTKEKEVVDLAERLENLNKKYRLVRERLDYMKHTTGINSNGCNDTATLNNNNNHEEDPDSSANPAVLLPGMRVPQRGGFTPNKSSTTAKAAAMGSTNGRQEDQSSQATVNHNVMAANVQVPKLVDPALAPDSDAPAW